MNRREMIEAASSVIAGIGLKTALDAKTVEAAPILLAVRPDNHLSSATIERIQAAFRPLKERLGIPVVVVPKGLQLEAVYDPSHKPLSRNFA